MSKITRNAARVTLSVGLLAGVSMAGAASASAASPRYTCTGSYPEVCLGIYYNASGGISYELVQGAIDYGTYYQYRMENESTGAVYYTTVTKATTSNWSPSKPFYDTRGGEYCASIHYGSTSDLGLESGSACVVS